MSAWCLKNDADVGFCSSGTFPLDNDRKRTMFRYQLHSGASAGALRVSPVMVCGCKRERAREGERHEVCAQMAPCWVGGNFEGGAHACPLQLYRQGRSD